MDSPDPAPNASPGPHPGARNVQYKGAPLDPDRGPGLGCFYAQVAVLVVLVVLTPLSVVWAWPSAISAALLIIVIALLLVAGQTVIFLLRLVAADRRAEGRRRRPLASATKTVGELEDEGSSRHELTSPEEPGGEDEPTAPDVLPPTGASDGSGAVRQ